MLCLCSCASVVQQVVDLEDRRAGADVVPLLKDPDPVVRRRALLALARIQDPLTAPAIAEALKQPDLVGEAAFAAGMLGLAWQPLDDDTKNRLTEALLKAEYHPRVVQALGRLGTPAAVARLVEGLEAGDATAALALGIAAKRGATVADGVVAPATALSTQGALDARYGATYLLAMLKRPSVVAPLLVALDDGDAEVRALAAKGLGDTGAAPDEATTAKLKRALEDGDVRVAVEAVRALLKLKVELPKLDGRPQLVLAALQAGAVVETPDPKLKCRVAMARDKKAGDYYESAICGPLALHEVGLPPPEKFLTGTSAEAVGALDAIGASKAVAYLPRVRPLLDSEDCVVAAAAAVAVAKLGDRESIPQLKKLARGVLTHEDVATSIATAVADLDAKEVIPELQAWLASRNATVRHSAAEALTKLTGSKVIAPEVPLAEADPMPKTGSGLLITTERGEIEIELWNDEHPRTAGNLWSLAKRGYFDGQTFHRVVPDFVVQGGDPRGDGEGGPGYMIRCEIGRRPYVRGTVGMALSGKDTGGSQFFITHTAVPHLDGRYTAFGRVKRGMEVVDALLEGEKMIKVTAIP